MHKFMLFVSALSCVCFYLVFNKVIYYWRNLKTSQLSEYVAVKVFNVKVGQS